MSNVILRDLKYENVDALENIFSYGLGIEKEDLNKRIPNVSWTAFGALSNTPQSAIDSFNMVKRLYEKTDGNLLHHVIVNIKPKRKLHDYFGVAQHIGYKLGTKLFKEGFQNALFIHEKNGYSHIHFIINSINYLNGKRIMSTGWLGMTINNFLYTNFMQLDWEYSVIYNSERHYHD